MKLLIEQGGALSTIQDCGRWGHQALGVPVSGAMDVPALIRGNLLLGNDPSSAALEMAFLGPSVLFTEGEGCIALAGGDLTPKINGTPVPMWTVLAVKPGDRLTFGNVHGAGCRAYLCVGGGIDVPLVMGSRSTYLRAKLGGFSGRALKAGDEIAVGTPWILWKRLEGLSCPAELRPDYSSDAPLRAVPGPQDAYVTPESLKAFYSTEYRISEAADRMGFRLEGGRPVEFLKGPDIVSDGIPLGAVQVPGGGQPIVMMADRQTTGGYVKIAVVHELDTARLAQKIPGQTVHFTSITQEEGIEISKREAAALEELRLYVQHWAARPVCAAVPRSGTADMSVDGRKYRVVWEKLD
jgi:antagonist of KipI